MSIKLWDLFSGVCVKTITSHFGEVTNVDVSPSGLSLLSTSKDNSNRMWDLRGVKKFQKNSNWSPNIFFSKGASFVRKFTGHQHASKTFVGSTFGPDEKVVIGGSEVSEEEEEFPKKKKLIYV